MNKAIEVIDVCKTYKLYSSPYDRMRDLLGLKNVKSKDFDALNKINLSVNTGDFFGILGRNGSGKSTLLKIIAGHTTQNSGEIFKNGKISLLQLGLGFDPELTGIENVIKSRELQNLNENSKEIISKIVDFSEIGDFINYPVKTYSSGMYSRLAFSAAIMSDFDILIADEVLSVGDLSFSQKCLKKMRELKDVGKTLVLVTHDIDVVKSFCDKAIWIDGGVVVASGAAKDIAEQFRNYMLYGVRPNEIQKSRNKTEIREEQQVKEGASWVEPQVGKLTIKKSEVEIIKYRILDKDFNIKNTFSGGDFIKFQMLYRNKNTDIPLTSIGITLHNKQGQIALHLNSSFFSDVELLNFDGLSIADFTFEVPNLSSGDYSISFGINGIKDYQDELLVKYDFDSSISINYDLDKTVNRQGGYAVVKKCEFGVAKYE